MPRLKKPKVGLPEHIARIVKAGGAITPAEQSALAFHVLGTTAPKKRKSKFTKGELAIKKNWLAARKKADKKNGLAARKRRLANGGVKKKISKALEKKMLAQLKKEVKAGHIVPKKKAANGKATFDNSFRD